MNSGQPFRALDFHREALDLFQELDDRAGIAGTLDLLAMTSNMCGEFEDTVNYYEQAIPILRRLNDRQTLASSLTMLSLYTLNETLAREALELARDIGWRSGEAYALQYLGSLLAYQGQYGQGLHYAREGLELAQAIDHHLWQAWGHIVLGTIHSELLSLEPTLRHLQTALETAGDVGSSFMTSLAGGLLASIYIQQDRLHEAASLLPGKITDDMLRTDYARLRAAVELRMVRDEPDQILKLLDRLHVPQRANWRGAMAYYYGTILYLRAETLLRLQDLPQAQATLQDLLDLHRQNGIGMGRWRVLILLGRVQRAAGDRRQAAATFGDARADITQLAGTVFDQDLRQNFRRRALDMIPPAPSLTPRQETKRRYDGLTRREREVAAVVARGLSNQEIADELVISIKTVEAHITRILSKLDFSSRAQIAAWAVKKGLTSS
jgi:DNA-binding CsgD family transcriptional regulator